ncbi:MAG: glycosyltransferase family 9 protein, partial [Candidatus Eremiobacterota bacterium]
VKTDAIGDYILFRNFIEYIYKSEKYKDFKIVLCGNIIWKNLAENLDKEYIDNFIWVDTLKFRKNIFYRLKLICQINKIDSDIAIQPNFSRDFYVGDSIIKCCKGNEKIGVNGDFCNISIWQKKMSDFYYTKIIDIKNNNLFEFDINKLIFEKLLNTKLDIKKPYVNKYNFNKLELTKPYAVLFPGAGSKKRKWSTKKFAAIGEYLYNAYGLHIFIAGSNTDTDIAREIKMYMSHDSMTDMTGNVSLCELFELIEGSELLISNETSAIHIAATVNTLTVCISNGNHYSRFSPYPEGISNKVYTIYPPEITEELNAGQEYRVIAKYRKGSSLDINLIEVEAVKLLISKIFG